MLKKERFAVFVGFLIAAGNVAAHPVSYQGATAIMAWNQPFLSDYWVVYSFRPDMAFAARSMRMEMPEGRLWVYLPQYDILLKRWNNLDSQANIYGYAGFGAVRMNSQGGTAWLTGIEADAESRSLYGSVKAETMDQTIGPNFNHYEIRIGAAPYEAEFNEIAAWLMLQVQYHPALTKKTAVTPLARFFYRSVLFEVGVSTDGDAMTNFMFHF